jgi:hypothetical protein
MFSKNPYVLPICAVVFLVILYMFQQQQKKKAHDLRAAQTASAPADTFSVALTLKDPVFGTTEGKPARCGSGKSFGLDYAVPGKLVKGRVEFDMFNYAASEEVNIPLFSLRPAPVQPCMPQLADQCVLGLFLNKKNDSLQMVIRTDSGTYSGKAQLTDKESVPFRLALEWMADTMTLFVNGKRNADVLYKGRLTQGDNRLLLGQSQEKKGAELRSLKVYLVP